MDDGAGKVVKVSGPLVVAEGIQNARMYDVVRVSDRRLIGEILELRGDKASIQVYEETSGLGPGEPVYTTGEPLSVELGPGLIESIYDGIQRPLDIIRTRTGDRIQRGVEAPGISREKKWKFEPRVKVGEAVAEGDILGIVQETRVVEHRIMVPYGIEGTLEFIHDGEATVTDVIARIRMGNEVKDVSMLQRWPVRRSRPHKEKLAPYRPLITGQRIIDTFFPVAKGGTACIPGPFGSGKCVSGETPVILASGEVVTMYDLYDRCLSEGLIRRHGVETVIELKKPLGLYSMVGGGIKETRSSTFYKGKSDSLLRIITRSGRVVEVTPVHKLFKVDGDASITETEARKLMVGDYITSVRKISLEVEDAIPVETMDEVYAVAGLAAPVPRELRGARYGQIVKFPERVTPELAELAGLFVAEGHIRDEGTLIFTNSDGKLRTQFSELLTSVFGIRGKPVTQPGKTPEVAIFSKTLVGIFKTMGLGGKSGEKLVPPVILKSSDSAIASFLRGYFLGDGSIYRGEIEFSTVSKELQIGLSYALTRLGIFHTLADHKILSEHKRRYRIFIRGRNNLAKFHRLINDPLEDYNKIRKIREYVETKDRGYTAIDVVPLAPEFIARLYRDSRISYSALVGTGIEISNYISNGEKMTSETFKKFAGMLGDLDSDVSRLASLLDYVFCDEVVSIEEKQGPFEVFDVSVPEARNFVGGFGGVVLHNTVVQHQLAKWSDADIIVYIGCGERGNEMTDVLMEFPELLDPRTGEPLMKRTVLVANTSDMPVAAREASIYTGITIGEYFRDMGYSVALMADSTSRWAEALREMSGRLEEMPGEEGYPAYLGSRAAAFYERAGRVTCLGKDGREGALTVVGAVSPPGGDLSEPVTQATLRIVKVFWGLDDVLASRRHFPAINWLISYSLYLDRVGDFLREEIGDDWVGLRSEAMKLLQEESELEEIVRLVGVDALSVQDRLTLEVARSVREDFLHQNAFHEADTYTSLVKQYRMLRAILEFHRVAREAIERGVTLRDLLELQVREKIGRMKYYSETDLGNFDELEGEIRSQVESLASEGGGDVA